IADNLEKERDINAFTKINHRLNYILNPYLYRYNALIWAAKQGRETTAQMLYNCEDINTSITDYHNRTLLILAVDYRRYIVVKLLLKVQKH
ncbi:hypothetical protein V2W45_1244020, partial [Cenococcum geophilum]